MGQRSDLESFADRLQVNLHGRIQQASDGWRGDAVPEAAAVDQSEAVDKGFALRVASQAALPHRTLVNLLKRGREPLKTLQPIH